MEKKLTLQQQLEARIKIYEQQSEQALANANMFRGKAEAIKETLKLIENDTDSVRQLCSSSSVQAPGTTKEVSS
jgi:predicted ribosome quality control (RQC) complex YloA/Tae2 family protein